MPPFADQLNRVGGQLRAGGGARSTRLQRVNARLPEMARAGSCSDGSPTSGDQKSTIGVSSLTVGCADSAAVSQRLGLQPQPTGLVNIDTVPAGVGARWMISGRNQGQGRKKEDRQKWRRNSVSRRMHDDASGSLCLDSLTAYAAHGLVVLAVWLAGADMHDWRNAVPARIRARQEKQHDASWIHGRGVCLCRAAEEGRSGG